MRFLPRRAALLIAATAAAVAVAVPTAAMAAPASAASDDTTAGAVPLVSNPATGTLGYAAGDEHDYYAITLLKGQRFTARLSASAGTNFDLYVYSADKTRISVDPPVALAWDVGYPDYLWDSNSPEMGFVAAQTGTYYLEVVDVAQPSVSGSYSVAWRVGVAPKSVTLNKSQTITIGTKVKLTGSVTGTSGAGVRGETVELLALAYNEVDDYTFKKKASTVTTVGGAFSFSVTPDRMTHYIAVSQGTVPGYVFWASPQRTISVKVALTAPVAPSSVTRGKKFTVSGYLNPQHKKGAHTVRVEAYQRKANGSYAWRKTISTTNAVSASRPTQTRYLTTSATLPSAGRWKLVAKTSDDGFHAATSSAATYVQVK